MTSVSHPFMKHQAAIRSALFAAITPARVKTMTEAQIKRANAGSSASFTALLDRVLGKSLATLDLRSEPIEMTPAQEAESICRKAIAMGRTDLLRGRLRTLAAELAEREGLPDDEAR